MKKNFVLTILLVLLTTMWSFAQTSTFSITLDEAQASAGNGTGSTGTGTGTATYDAGTMTLTVSGSYNGLIGNTTACHVHIAAAGSNGGVVFGLTLSPSGSTAGNFYGSGVLSTTQETALLTDGFYVNVHTSHVGSGEIRGQILLNPAPNSDFTINLDEAQANAGAGTGSAGMGTGSATYDPNTMTLTVSGNFSGLTGNTTACHVHDAPAGSNGGVVFGLTLSPSGSTAGTFSGSGILSAAQETALFADGFYVNVHTSHVGSGEIRGQISLVVTPPAQGDSCLINWTNLQQAALYQGGRRLRKITNNPTGYSGGAISQHFIGKNEDGWIQMEALQTHRRVVFGLSNNNMDPHKSSIRHAIELRGNGIALVLEYGYKKHNIGTYAIGDVFRIEKTSSSVKYYQNGIVVYTSLKQPNRKLFADASLYSLNGIIYKAYSSFSCMSSAKTTETPTVYETNTTPKFNEITAYPNPFVDNITLDYTNDVEHIQSIELYNMNGQHIQSIEISQDGQTTVDTNHLNSGLYIISINRTKHLKVVKM